MGQRSDSTRYLLRSIAEGNRPLHACLLTGPHGVGKRRAALDLARATLCHNGRFATSCSCVSCTAFAGGVHPDFFHLRPEAGRDSSQISIDDVRALKSRLGLTSALGGRKTAVIERVEMLSREAASAILKLLEEPSGRTLIILTAERYRSVLATIRSRAIRVMLPPATAQELREGLAGQYDDLPEPDRERYSRLAEGRPELFRALLEPETGKMVKDIATFLEKLPSLTFAERFQKSEEIQRTDTMLRWFFVVLASALRGVLRTQSAKPETAAVRRAQALLRCETLSTHTNTNRRLLLETLLMQF